MSDAEKIGALIDAMQRIRAAAERGLSDAELASVALSYATHALQLVGALAHAPLPSEALAYGRDVVAQRIAQRLGQPSE